MILQIYTDGGSKGNPGPASVGVVYFLNGTETDTYREDIGVATNNEAEYTALIRAFERLMHSPKLPATTYKKIEVFSDSKLMVNQLNGLFKVREGRIREFIFTIRGLENQLNKPITYMHIPREKNTIADDLVNNKK